VRAVGIILLCLTGPLFAGVPPAADAPQEDGTTALHWAVHEMDLARVTQLIAAGANANATNDYGVTPLAEAAVTADPAIIRALLKAGANVEGRNPEGQTALMVVARTGRIEAADLLLRRGADVNAAEAWRGQTALMWAALEGQADMVRLLARHGAKLDARSKVNDWARQVTAERRGQWRPIGGLTALLFAARQGELDAVRALVEAGADPNLPDPEGVTPMLMAATNYHFDVVAYLLSHGGDPNRWDWRGRTPLYAVVDLNTLPHGGRPELPSLDHMTSLELIDRLLQAGANPNAQLKLFPDYRHLKDDRGADNVLTIGSTPLLRAAKAFDAPALRLLLARGARTDLPTIDGYTPLMLAAGLGDTAADTRGVYDTKDVQQRAIAALTLLLDAGADVNAVNRKGQTALFGAVWWGWDDVVRVLAHAGARLDVADGQGKTLADAAAGRAAQGKGRGSQGEDPHPATAALIESLVGRK
jgi:uncharacterized protein